MRDKEIVIRLRLPRWPGRRWLVLGTSLIVLGSAAALATIPSFADNTTLRAADLNRLVDALNKTITAQGAFCGLTEKTDGSLTVGQATGYVAAKKQCEATCASTTAHICTAQELIVNAEGGWKPPEGGYFWYATAVWNYYGALGGAANDCAGFTSKASSDSGAIWIRDDNSGFLGPSIDKCSMQFKILCCD